MVEVPIPPLRERCEDIPQLVAHFLGIFAARYHREKKTLSRETLRLLMVQPWRGNVRELEHALLNAWILSDNEELEPSDFDWAQLDSSASHPAASSEGSVQRGASVPVRPAAGPRSGGPSQADEERSRILAALQACGQNRVRAAQMLGIPRRPFYRRLHDYGIQ